MKTRTPQSRIRWSWTIKSHENGLVRAGINNSKAETVYSTEFVSAQRLDEIAELAFRTGRFERR